MIGNDRIIAGASGLRLPSPDTRERRRWVVPKLAPHSTLTTLTQVPLSQPLSLLFLQSSQCFDQDGNPAPCP